MGCSGLCSCKQNMDMGVDLVSYCPTMARQYICAWDTLANIIPEAWLPIQV